LLQSILVFPQTKQYHNRGKPLWKSFHFSYYQKDKKEKKKVSQHARAPKIFSDDRYIRYSLNIFSSQYTLSTASHSVKTSIYTCNMTWKKNHLFTEKRISNLKDTTKLYPLNSFEIKLALLDFLENEHLVTLECTFLHGLYFQFATCSLCQKGCLVIHTE